MRDYITKAQDGEALTRDEAWAAMDAILGEAGEEQIREFLLAMNAKPLTAGELTGFAQGMRARATTISPGVDRLLDTCGTGGDGTSTINVSTGSAIMASAAGLPVAKHGNRSVSSRSGSADVLEAMGYTLDQEPEFCRRMIEDTGFGFLYAPRFHPAMKKVAPVRRQIGERTIFNLLGPLCNPANAGCQLIGVYDPQLCGTFAHTLRELGLERALVVYGSGLDEISNIGETEVHELRDGCVSSYRIAPEEFGMRRYELADIHGSSPAENAGYLRAILGAERGPRRDLLVMNAGAGIYVGGRATSLEEGIAMAAKTLDSGAAFQKLSEIISYSGR